MSERDLASREKLPPIPTEALKDHTDDPRLDDIWHRLEDELPHGGAHAGAARRGVLWWAAPAALVATFAGGVLVGARWFSPPMEQTATVRFEPRVQENQAAGNPEQQPQVIEAPQPATREQPELKRRPKTLAPRPTARTVPEPGLPAEEASMGPAAPVAVVQTPRWQQLTNEGDYKGALQAMEKTGGFAQALQASSAEQLMTLAEMARGVGKRGWEIQALKRVVEQHRSDPNAGVAALMLVNRLKKAGDKAGAARYLEEYRRLSPDGDFAEDALAAEVLTAIEQGDGERARKLASEYEQKFPKGRRGQEIRDALAQLEAAAEAEESVDAGAPKVEAPPRGPGAGGKHAAEPPVEGSAKRDDGD